MAYSPGTSSHFLKFGITVSALFVVLLIIAISNVSYEIYLLEKEIYKEMEEFKVF